MYQAFIPKRLNQVREEIAIRHENQTEVPLIKPVENLKDLILRIAALQLHQVKRTAMSLTDEEVLLIAGYLPHNYFRVKLRNLFEVYKLRANKQTGEILFREWQDAYDSKECNQFMIDLLLYDELFIVQQRSYHLTEELFKTILSADNIALSFGREAYRNAPSTCVNLVQKMDYYGVRKESRLYIDAAFLIYTFCNKELYIKTPNDELLRFVRQYDHRLFKQFLKNFLNVLLLKELVQFKKIADYCITQTGEVGTNKFNTFFADFDSESRRKYTNWINVYRINTYFNNDDRSRFWKQYEFLSVRKYNISDSVVMEFEKYYAIEFLGYQMGPIYIYERKIFEDVIESWFRSNNNHDLRSLLYNTKDKYASYRKTHNGYWQIEVNRVLLRNGITSKLKEW